MNGHADGPELSAYLDGALLPEPRARVELHMSSCADCRAELDSLRHMKLALASAPRKSMPADLALTLERRFVHGQRRLSVRVGPFQFSFERIFRAGEEDRGAEGLGQ